MARKEYYWHTPAGTLYAVYEDMLTQSHLLIAGATGSGKSTLENALIYTALINSPATRQFIMIDPKRVELARYWDLPHVIQYEDDAPSKALQTALTITEDRYKAMQREGVQEYTGGHVYVIIDELMPIMTDSRTRRECMPILQKLLAIARAAHVHVWALTQSPVRDVIPTTLKCNFDARIGLRTASRQDSRNILDMAGCETLPDPRSEGTAQMYYRHGSHTDLYTMARIEPEEINRVIDHWKKHRKPHFMPFAGRRH